MKEVNDNTKKIRELAKRHHILCKRYCSEKDENRRQEIKKDMDVIMEEVNLLYGD